MCFDNFSEWDYFCFCEAGRNEKYMPPQIMYRDFYHYTSPEALCNILFNKEDSNNVVLWASRFDCFEDHSECLVAQEVYKGVCQENFSKYPWLLDIAPENSHLFQVGNTKKYQVGNTIHNEVHYTFQPGTCYIASFSLADDSAYMWQNYTKNEKCEGYNIEFNIYPNDIKVKKASPLDILFPSIHIFPVIYDYNEQKRFVFNFLTDVLKFYSNNSATQEQVSACIASQLSDWAPIFKSERYRNEQEVRIFTYIADEQQQSCVHERICNGKTIPYIELQIDKDAVILVRMALSGSNEQLENQEKRLADALQKNGYHALPIISKVVPKCLSKGI